MSSSVQDYKGWAELDWQKLLFGLEPGTVCVRGSASDLKVGGSGYPNVASTPIKFQRYDAHNRRIIFNVIGKHGNSEVSVEYGLIHNPKEASNKYDLYWWWHVPGTCGE
jgi:hypothetical protein